MIINIAFCMVAIPLFGSLVAASSILVSMTACSRAVSDRVENFAMKIMGLVFIPTIVCGIGLLFAGLALR